MTVGLVEIIVLVTLWKVSKSQYQAHGSTLIKDLTQKRIQNPVKHLGWNYLQN